MKKILSIPIVLSLAASFLVVATAGVAWAWPSRSEDCSICHSIPGPSAQTGDFEIKDLAGNPTTAFSVAAGDSTGFRLDITSLKQEGVDPDTGDPVYGRGYMIIEKLDLLNVAPGDYASIPYTAPKYTPTNVGHAPGEWHPYTTHGNHQYVGPYGQYYAQSSTDPTASLLFPLTIHADAVPGTYNLTAKLVGGSPEPDESEGWITTKNFTLTVTGAPLSVPEPATSVLLVLGLGAFGLYVRRRKRAA